MDIDVIGVPLWEGSGRRGPEEGPSQLWNGGMKEIVAETGHQLGRYELLCAPVEGRDRGERMMYTGQVVDCCRRLEQSVAATAAAGRFPLVVGGDHALALGSISGLSHTIPARDLSVIWIDAHTDINTAATSETRHIHGMPVSACMGEGDPALIDGFGRAQVKLLPQHLFYIGTRCVDEAEWEILKDHHIRWYGMEELRQKGIEAVAREVLAQIHTPHIHISFDVDFIGSEEFTATGLPIPDGPTVEETHQCLRTLCADERLGSMDFVEYNPARDPDGRGLTVCLELLHTCLGAMGQRNG